MAVTNFAINLKSSQLVYYPGQDIVGTVAIKLDAGNEASDLIVKLIGKSQCRFVGRTGKHGRGHDAHTKEFHKHHIIVEHEKILSSPSVGEHDLEFDFNLPPKIPSSVEAAYGNIRYVLSAHLGDNIVSRSITVNEIIDTNSEEYETGPRGEAQEDVKSCICIGHGNLDINGSLSRSCYCPGEAILITVDITNEASRNMNALKASLVQTMKYKTKDRTKSVTSVLTSIKGPKIKKGETHAWDAQPLGIPASVPTISNDAVVSIEYHVKITLGVNFGGDLGLILPVRIGTIPHMQEKFIERYGTTEYPQPAPTSSVVSGPPVDLSVLGFSGTPVPLYSKPIVLKGKGKGESNMSFEDDDDSQIKYSPVYTFVKPEKSGTGGGEGGSGKSAADIATELLNDTTNEGSNIAGDVIVE